MDERRARNINVDRQKRQEKERERENFIGRKHARNYRVGYLRFTAAVAAASATERVISGH